MKNKKNIYILLAFVLLIWGLVIYRFVSFSKSEIHDIATAQQFSTKPVEVYKKDTIVFNINYRDPFLGKIYVPQKTEKAIKKRNKTVKEPIQWPHVTYKGIVSDSKNSRKVFMLIINGQTHLAKENETVNDIFLKTGGRHYVILKYKGEATKVMIQE